VALNYSPDFEHLVLLLKLLPLAQKLGALIGSAPDRLPRVALTADYRRPENQAFRRLVFFLAEELSIPNNGMAEVALAELEQAVIVAFLSSSAATCGHPLDATPRPPAPWQVRRAEEYIEANWDQPITIEALAIVTDASVRSLFHAFKAHRGYSPMAFVKQVRLRRARRMLEDANASSTGGVRLRIWQSWAFLPGILRNASASVRPKPSAGPGASRQVEYWWCGTDLTLSNCDLMVKNIDDARITLAFDESNCKCDTDFIGPRCSSLSYL
jgi:AraC-like DNA-binding protein